MTKKTTLLLKSLFCLWLAAAIPANAYAETYFRASTVPPTLLTPPFLDATGQQKELDYIIELQKQPSPEEVKRAAAEGPLNYEFIMQSVDPSLSRTSHPALFHLLDRVSDTAGGITGQAKEYWHTKRPYLTDARIKPLIGEEHSPAYPSGHTSGTFTMARVLGMIFTEKRTAFMARAEEVAQHRVLVGLHFPTDVAGGKELGALIIGALTQNEQFQKDLEAAKQEAANIHP